MRKDQAIETNTVEKLSNFKGKIKTNGGYHGKLKSNKKREISEISDENKNGNIRTLKIWMDWQERQART